MGRRFPVLAALVLAASLGSSCALIDALTADEVDCLDGKDNDDNGLQDCEDPACRGTRVCSQGVANEFNELCNGVDEVDSFYTGLVDEVVCACINDAGCDDLGQVCERRLWITVENSGTCVPPDCNVYDYCSDTFLGACLPDGSCDFDQ